MTSCMSNGFLPKKSTEHNLMQILNNVTSALNDGMYCIGVFLDLKKAFDVCSHSILLAKLKKWVFRKRLLLGSKIT